MQFEQYVTNMYNQQSVYYFLAQNVAKGQSCAPSAPSRMIQGVDVMITIFCDFRKTTLHLGCQMVRFHTKNTNLGKFWRLLQCKMLVYFMAICLSYILRLFVIS
jgi:hypothetical protein